MNNPYLSENLKRIGISTILLIFLGLGCLSYGVYPDFKEWLLDKKEIKALKEEVSNTKALRASDSEAFKKELEFRRTTELSNLQEVKNKNSSLLEEIHQLKEFNKELREHRDFEKKLNDTLFDKVSALVKLLEGKEKEKTFEGKEKEKTYKSEYNPLYDKIIRAKSDKGNTVTIRVSENGSNAGAYWSSREKSPVPTGVGNYTKVQHVCTNPDAQDSRGLMFVHYLGATVFCVTETSVYTDGELYHVVSITKFN